MKQLYRELAHRIRGELTDLERITQRIIYLWPVVKKATLDQDVYVESVALNLHSFYSGLERLFELVAKRIDRNLPSGETWHRDLLAFISQPTEARPAIISRESALQLDEFLRFRHLVRNVYTTNLKGEKIGGLVATLPNLWPHLKTELLAFANFLERVANELDN